MFNDMKIQTNSAKALFLSTRPQSLFGALIPVLLGTSLAYSHGAMHLPSALLCALFAASMQVATNLFNDYYDLKMGLDTEDQEDMARAYANGWITQRALVGIMVVSLCVAIVAGMSMFLTRYDIMPYKGWELVAIGLACMVTSFLYSCFFSYVGLGDVMVLLFFGLVPVCGTYYVQVGGLSLAAVLVSIISGLVIDTMLAINNYRDMETDGAKQKNTIVVRLGKEFGKCFYWTLGCVAALLTLVLAWMGTLSWVSAVVVAAIYLMIHTTTMRKMLRMEKISNISALLYGENARNMLLMGLMLSIAIVIG